MGMGESMFDPDEESARARMGAPAFHGDGRRKKMDEKQLEHAKRRLREIGDFQAQAKSMSERACTPAELEVASDKLLFEAAVLRDPGNELIIGLIDRVTSMTKERDSLKDKIERFGNTEDPSQFDWNVLQRIDELEGEPKTTDEQLVKAETQRNKLAFELSLLIGCTCTAPCHHKEDAKKLLAQIKKEVENGGA